jgi:hypothetical protein
MMKRALLATALLLLPVAADAQLPPAGYPESATPIVAAAAGTTGAVTATLAAAVGKTTYLCGFDVSVIGGTAAVGPITVGLLPGSKSFIYQMSSTAAGLTLSRTFTPCVPGSAPDVAITIVTTADGSASAVDVNAWGYQN